MNADLNAISTRLFSVALDFPLPTRDAGPSRSRSRRSRLYVVDVLAPAGHVERNEQSTDEISIVHSSLDAANPR